MPRHLPKVDLHVHLEGTMTPAMAQRIAYRNNVELPKSLLGLEGAHYRWVDDGTAASALVGFLEAYDAATFAMRKPEDYADITYDYLKRSAEEGCIYAEIIISADHGAMVGISYPAMLEAISRGYERAKKEYGIEMRLLASAVRHYGPEKALMAAEVTRRHPHPLVTGMTLAGDENAWSVKDFLPAFERSGLKNRTAHAGEAAGPESIRAARDILGVRRYGHMVRAIEDSVLMHELKLLNAVPEICISSNLVMKVFKDYKSHPVRKFFDYGFKVVFGSDDPPFFRTSIGREYQLAQEQFGFSDKDLLCISATAIEEAFVDENTRDQLMDKVLSSQY